MALGPAGLLALLCCVVKLVSAQEARCTSPDYAWANNKEGKDPCQLANSLLTKCNAAPFVALPPGTSMYGGPGEQSDCLCNLVEYNLLRVCAKCQSSADAFVEDYRDWSKNCAKKDQVTFAPGAPNGVDIPAWASAGSVSGSWSLDTLKNAVSPPMESNTPKKKVVEYKEPEPNAGVIPQPEAKAETKTPPQQDDKPRENFAVDPASKQEDPKSRTLQLPQSSEKPKEYDNSSKTRDFNSVSTSSSTSTTSTQRSQTKARPFVPNFTPRPLDSAQAVAEEEDDEEEPPSVEENDLTAQGKEAGQADNQKHREEPGDDHSIPEGLNNDNTLNLAAADAGPSTKAANGQRIRPLANGQDDLAQEDSPFVPKIKTPTRTTSSASSQLPTMLADGISDLGASAEYDIDAEEDSEDDIALPPKDFAALPDLSDDPEDGIDGTESEEYNETEENDEDDANPDEDQSTSTVSELLQAEETAISSLEGMSDTSKDADAPSDEPDAADRDSDTADISDIPEQASDGEEAGFGAVGRYQYNGDPGVEVVENEEKENKKKIAIICGTLAGLLVLGVIGFKLFMCLRRREDDNDMDDDRETWMGANPTGITKESIIAPKGLLGRQSVWDRIQRSLMPATYRSSSQAVNREAQPESDPPPSLGVSRDSLPSMQPVPERRSFWSSVRKSFGPFGRPSFVPPVPTPNLAALRGINMPKALRPGILKKRKEGQEPKRMSTGSDVETLYYDEEAIGPQPTYEKPLPAIIEYDGPRNPQPRRWI